MYLYLKDHHLDFMLHNKNTIYFNCYYYVCDYTFYYSYILGYTKYIDNSNQSSSLETIN